MTQRNTTHPPRRQLAGFVRLDWVVILIVLALAIGGVIYLAVFRGDANSTNPPPTTQEEINQALGILQQSFQTALQEKQDLTRLAAQARAFTEEYPDEQGGYVLLAQTRMGLNQWGQAYDAWKKSLSFDGGAFELNKMAGLCAAKLGKNEQALTHYQRAVASEKVDNEVFAALGRLHLSLNDVDNAEAMFTKAIDARGAGEKDNYRHEAYAGLADVAAVRGDVDTAVYWIDRAIKMAKLDSGADSAAYHIQKARIYMDADRDEDAVTMLGYTWSEFPDALWRIESARLRAKLYERAGQLDDAVKYVQTVTEYHRLAETRNNETLANFTALLADWQLKANRIEDARISLHNLQTLAPNHPAIDGLQARLR